jgi:hypothetical protein
LKAGLVVPARSSCQGHLLARGNHAAVARKIHLSRVFSFPEPPLSERQRIAIHRDGDTHLRGQLGLKPCFTPSRSPQSNGISEAFVNTLKRDYVRVTSLPDAATVLGLIGGWIHDYNENHPHSGLRMRSPREFIVAKTAAECVSVETEARSMPATHLAARSLAFIPRRGPLGYEPAP